MWLGPLALSAGFDARVAPTVVDKATGTAQIGKLPCRWVWHAFRATPVVADTCWCVNGRRHYDLLPIGKRPFAQPLQLKSVGDGLVRCLAVALRSAITS